MKLISVSKRTRHYPEPTPGSRRGRSQRLREYNAMPRVYFTHAAESVLENLANRTSRPIAGYRRLIPDVLRMMSLPAGTGHRWSRNAGCSMCPCSPGFILDGVPHPSRFDLWVEVAGEQVDSRDPAAVARAIDRARQILSDPALIAGGDDERTALGVTEVLP